MKIKSTKKEFITVCNKISYELCKMEVFFISNLVQVVFLKAQFLCNRIDVTDSLTDPLGLLDDISCSLQFCNLEFDKQAISDGCRSEIARYWWRVLNLSDFRELIFCGPCGPCFPLHRRVKGKIR